MTAALTFAVLLPVLLVSHNVADHWVQSDWQASNKGLPGWPGRKACAAHVATYTLTTALAVGAVWLLFGLPITPLGFLAGQLISALTHYWADRRFTLRKLCDTTGKGRFYRLGTPRETLRAVTTDGNYVVGLEHQGGFDHPDFDPLPDTVLAHWDNPCLGTGAYALDQSWHWFWLFIAAFITAVVS